MSNSHCVPRRSRKRIAPGGPFLGRHFDILEAAHADFLTENGRHKNKKGQHFFAQRLQCLGRSGRHFASVRH